MAGGLVGGPASRAQGGGSGGGATYLVPAVNGFVRSIDLGGAAGEHKKNANGHVQQDILRLLTLWFKYGNPSSSLLPTYAHVRGRMRTYADVLWRMVQVREPV